MNQNLLVLKRNFNGCNLKSGSFSVKINQFKLDCLNYLMFEVKEKKQIDCKKAFRIEMILYFLIINSAKAKKECAEEKKYFRSSLFLHFEQLSYKLLIINIIQADIFDGKYNCSNTYCIHQNLKKKRLCISIFAFLFTYLRAPKFSDFPPSFYNHNYYLHYLKYCTI